MPTATTHWPMRTLVRWCCIETTPTIRVNDIGAQRVTLDENKDYRIILEVIGNDIHGQVTEIATGTLVAESFKNIANNPNVYTSGTSGVFGYTQSPFKPGLGSTTFGRRRRWPATTIAMGPSTRPTMSCGATRSANNRQIWTPSTFKVISLGDMRANGAISGNCGFNTPNCEVIDEADYEVWRANFGRTVSSGSAVGGGSCRTRASQCRAGSDGIAVRRAQPSIARHGRRLRQVKTLFFP